MKLKNILTITLFAIALISCKKDSDEAETSSEEGKLPETVSVTFNVTVQKDDTFSLLYTEDKSLNFGEDRMVTSILKGSDKPQDVIFKLPVDVLPTNIRFDIGHNKEQGEMSINSIKATYFSKSFEHKENIVKGYFYFNDTQLAYDDKTSKVKAVIGSDKRHVPLMWSNELLRDEFIKLCQGK